MQVWNTDVYVTVSAVFAEMYRWYLNFWSATVLKSTNFPRPAVLMKEPSAMSAFWDQNNIGFMIQIDVIILIQCKYIFILLVCFYLFCFVCVRMCLCLFLIFSWWFVCVIMNFGWLYVIFHDMWMHVNF